MYDCVDDALTLDIEIKYFQSAKCQKREKGKESVFNRIDFSKIWRFPSRKSSPFQIYIKQIQKLKYSLCYFVNPQFFIFIFSLILGIYSSIILLFVEPIHKISLLQHLQTYPQFLHVMINKNTHPPTNLSFMSKLKAKIQRTIFYNLPELIFADIVEESDGVQSSKLITIWSQPNSKYQFWVEIHFDMELWVFGIEGYFTINATPCTIQKHYAKISSITLFQNLNKHLTKNFDRLQFDFNPLTGTPSIASKFLMNPLDIEENIEKLTVSKDVQKNLAQILSHSSLLLQIIEMSNNGESRISESSSEVGKHWLKKLSRIEGMLETGVEVINPNIQEIENFTNFHEISRYFALYYSPVSLNPQNIIQKISRSYVSKQEKNELKNLTNFILQVSSNSQSCSDYLSQQDESLVKVIKILQQHPKWQILTKGGNGIIEKAEVSYQLSQVNTSNQTYQFTNVHKGWILRKSDRNFQHKIKREMKIVSLFKNQYHPNILNYYISEYSYPQFLYFKYHTHMSLETYLKNNANTMSLLTVLRFLEHISRGLIFLKYKEIIHFDIKPNNIIITENLIAKIIDFGESIYLPKFYQYTECGMTIPYAPFQMIRGFNSISFKVDIFSFGVTIHYLLFRQQIWGNRNDISKFRQKYKKNELKKVVVPEKFEHLGFRKFLTEMEYLVLQAISTEQNDRPSIDYMFLILFLTKKYVKEFNFPQKLKTI